MVITACQSHLQHNMHIIDNQRCRTPRVSEPRHFEDQATLKTGTINFKSALMNQAKFLAPISFNS